MCLGLSLITDYEGICMCLGLSLITDYEGICMCLGLSLITDYEGICMSCTQRANKRVLISPAAIELQHPGMYEESKYWGYKVPEAVRGFDA